ncbi:nickel ABC transporter substrate-binding protein [Paludifilum halophilum]|uniref:nickel ABC transporter substrate-binding protein n=1 Tax=Paludifilum halophilum TaxID=1642702 RepID=UPI001F0A135A|nr:nickel ABC transporter substrate-binding protein [Paludifilum halophilum]
MLSRSRFFVKRLLWLTVVLALVVAGCSPDAGNSGHRESGDKEITLMFSFKSPDLNPHHTLTPLRAGITETSIKLDSDLQLKGWLAKDWTSKDDQTWEFIIRDGIRFHDGTKMDAAAVKASFERGIRESKALANALKVESMQAEGQKLTIKTTEPHPSLPSELVNPYASVVQAEAEKKMGRNPFNKKPIGTGPFQVKRFTPNTEVVVERNDHYWDGKPKLKGATIRFNEDPNVRALTLQSGEADIAFNLPPENVASIQKEEDLKVESIPSLRVHFLLYNQQKSQMRDLRVRRALDHLLDRQSIVRDIMLGHASPANGPFTGELPFSSKKAPVKKDVSKAQELLKEAGYQKDSNGKMAKGGKPLTLELVTYGARPELPRIAQLFQSDAAQAGIDVKIKTVEDVDSHLNKNESWDVVTYSNLTAPRGDGAYFLNTSLVPEGSLNPSNLDLPALNKIVDELNATDEMEKRTELTREAVTVLHQELPHSYAVYPGNIYGINKRIVGWTPGLEEYYILTHTMDVE